MSKREVFLLEKRANKSALKMFIGAASIAERIKGVVYDFCAHAITSGPCPERAVNMMSRMQEEK